MSNLSKLQNGPVPDDIKKILNYYDRENVERGKVLRKRMKNIIKSKRVQNETGYASIDDKLDEQRKYNDIAMRMRLNQFLNQDPTNRSRGLNIPIYYPDQEADRIKLREEEESYRNLISKYFDRPPQSILPVLNNMNMPNLGFNTPNVQTHNIPSSSIQTNQGINTLPTPQNATIQTNPLLNQGHTVPTLSNTSSNNTPSQTNQQDLVNAINTPLPFNSDDLIDSLANNPTFMNSFRNYLNNMRNASQSNQSPINPQQNAINSLANNPTFMNAFQNYLNNMRNASQTNQGSTISNRPPKPTTSLPPIPGQNQGLSLDQSEIDFMNIIHNNLLTNPSTVDITEIDFLRGFQNGHNNGTYNLTQQQLQQITDDIQLYNNYINRPPTTIPNRPPMPTTSLPPIPGQNQPSTSGGPPPPPPPPPQINQQPTQGQQQTGQQQPTSSQGIQNLLASIQNPTGSKKTFKTHVPKSTTTNVSTTPQTTANPLATSMLNTINNLMPQTSSSSAGNTITQPISYDSAQRTTIADLDGDMNYSDPVNVNNVINYNSIVDQFNDGNLILTPDEITQMNDIYNYLLTADAQVPSGTQVIQPDIQQATQNIQTYFNQQLQNQISHLQPQNPTVNRLAMPMTPGERGILNNALYNLATNNTISRSQQLGPLENVINTYNSGMFNASPQEIQTMNDIYNHLQTQNPIIGFGLEDSPEPLYVEYEKPKAFYHGRGYKINEDGMFGDLSIDMDKLENNLRLEAYKGKKKVISRKIDQDTYDILTKRYNSKKQYSPKAVEVLNKLVELSDINPHKLKNKKKLVNSEKIGGKVMLASPDELVLKLSALIKKKKLTSNDKNMLSEIADKLLELDAIDEDEHKKIFRKYID